ncbi:diguanylate cyclase [Mycobacterium sp. pV006]|uniref:GGDEF domain-containing protein n=1 Tax=Mycobacterium sp. pV006 TaxID=3238983 RepID=UPI00351BD13F
MEKGFREFFSLWWRQPFDFDWTARHLRARGLLRVHQVFIGSFALLYGVTATLTFAGGLLEGGPPGGGFIVLAIALSSAALGVLWIVGPWPTRHQSAAFTLYADFAVVAVIVCCGDAFTAMPGLALLAANGIYVVVVHGPRALLAHLMFTAVAFAYVYGMALWQGTASPTVTTVRLLVLLPTVIGVQVIVQSYLLALRMGAVDALHDPLTRLYNRRGFDIDVLELVPTGSGRIGVLAIDIDKFKAINDTFGHDAGDRVLVAVADAARDAVTRLGVRSVTARTGGEEFVIVADADPSTMDQLARLLHEELADRAFHAVPVTISVGVATMQLDGHDVREAVRLLVERADHAMYQAKGAGGNRTVIAEADPAA